MSLPNRTSIAELLAAHAERIPTSIAVLGIDGLSLTYHGLWDLVKSTLPALNSLGIGRNDRVALVVSQGPVMLTAFLAVASSATCVPLGVGLQADEYALHFSSIGVKFLIVETGLDTQVRAVAQSRNIPIIELEPVPDAQAGIFTLKGEPSTPTAVSGFASADDILVVHTTSGTTGRSKIIPMGQDFLLASAVASALVVDRGEQNRILSIFPIVHSGTSGEVLRLLSSGGTLVYTPGFDGAQFFEWLDRFRPDYLTATSSIYRTILTQAPQYLDIIARSSLRFLRATSMASTPELLEELEQVFKVPVIDAYGSTEGGLMTVNPLPPLPRKRGSVGIVASGELRIADEVLNSLPPCQTGEILYRGPRVIKEYENNPEATQAAFVDGWYRTGDQGYLDDDGYLFITGRVKEFINHGGIKISPHEIEEVLLAHPSIKEVVAFAVPDAYVGEEIGVAIILQARATLTERDVREHILSRLSDSKIPRRIVFVNELPKTPLGKLQRIGLAERLGLVVARRDSRLSEAYVAPKTPLEAELVEIWAEILNRAPDSIGTTMRFRDVGGDSLAATRLVFRVREKLQVMVTILDFFDAPTIVQQAQVIENLQATIPSERAASTVIPIRAAGKYPPLFCLHALNGGIYFYDDVVSYLNPEQPVYGLQAVGMDGTVPPLQTLDEVVSYNISQIRALQLHGPYFLTGYSYGGNIALEIARRLRDVSQEAAYVFIIDSHFQVNYFDSVVRNRPANPAVKMWWRAKSLGFAIFNLPMPYKRQYFREKLNGAQTKLANIILNKNKRQVISDDAQDFGADDALLPPAIQAVNKANNRIGTNWVPQPYYGPITYLRADHAVVSTPFFRVWKQLVKGPAEIINISAGHFTLMKEPHVRQVAETLQQWLDNLHAQANHRL